MAKALLLAKSFYRYCALNLFAIMERHGIWPDGYLAGYSLRPPNPVLNAALEALCPPRLPGDADHHRMRCVAHRPRKMRAVAHTPQTFPKRSCPSGSASGW